MKFLTAALLPFLPFIFLGLSPAHAANLGDIVINEIAWMGTTNYHGDEWIELYNNSNTPISLEGWILRSTDGEPSINLAGTIAPNSFFLLERTDETTLPNHQADQIYTGALENGGEHLELLDAAGTLIDRINAFGGWPAGDNAENTKKHTMERKNPNVTGSDPVTWRTSTAVGGTPKAQNSVYEIEQISPPPVNPVPSSSEPISPPITSTTTSPQPSDLTPAPPADELNTSTLIQTPLIAKNIYINELMPYPLGADELEEWIELTNESDEEAPISMWKVKDMSGAINVYTFPEGSNIAARGFLVLSRPTTKITMNNDNDGMQLIRPDGELIQTVPYEKAPKGKSYVRSEGIWKWSAIPTPGSANIVPASPQTGTLEDVKKTVQKYNVAPQPSTSPPAPLLTKDRGGTPSTQTASINESASAKISSQLTVFLAALVALFSAVFIFLLKKRLRS